MSCIRHVKTPNKDGYGKMYFKGKMEFCHRVAYCNHNGVDIETIRGKVIRHTCDNPSCINPDHLLIGTHQDNMDDRSKRNRQAKRANHGTAKLSEADVRYIRAHYKFHDKVYNSVSLGKMFNVSHRTIINIVSNSNWVNQQEEYDNELQRDNAEG